MNITRAFDKLAQCGKSFFRLAKSVVREKGFPFGFRALECFGKWQRGTFRFRSRSEQMLKRFPNNLPLAAMPGIEFRGRPEAHQTGQTLARRGVRRNSVRLAIGFHLQPMLNIAKEDVGGRKLTRLLAFE